MDTDIVEGLFFSEQWGNNLIQMGNLFLGKGNAGTFFGKNFPVFFPGIQRQLNTFFRNFLQENLCLQALKLLPGAPTFLKLR